MSSLRSRKWFIRVSQKNETTEGIFEYDIKKIYEKIKDKYKIVIYIAHDKDLENVHYHFIIQHVNAIRFDTLKNIFPYGNIEKQRGSNKTCYEYLMHKNEERKEKYSEEEIIHDLSKEELNYFLADADSEKSMVGIDLIDCVENAQSLWEVFKKNPHLWYSATQVKLLWEIYLGRYDHNYDLENKKTQEETEKKIKEMFLENVNIK